MSGVVHLSIGNLADRRFQIFAVSTSYPPGPGADSTDLFSCWKQTIQPGAPWTDWERWIGQAVNQGPGPYGGPPQTAARSCAVQLFDNRLMLLVLDSTPDGSVFVTWKQSPEADAGWAPFTQWNNLSGYHDLAAARLVDGRAQIFATTGEGGIQTFWQVSNIDTDDPNLFFSQFYPMPPQDFSIPGQSIANQITAAQLWSGQVQVWVADYNGLIWSRWKKYNSANPQDPDTDWVDWQPFAASDPTPRVPGPGVRQISSSRLSDGRVQLFALTDFSQIWTSWQQARQVDSGWTPWSVFQPAPVAVRWWTAAGLSAANRTQLWAVATSGQLWTCWDNGADTGWSQWEPMNPALPWT